MQGSGFGVRGSGFGVQGSGFVVQGSGFGVQGSGFGVQGSGFGVRGCGGGFAAIYDATPESLQIAVLSYRHPERAETTYVRQSLPERVRTESKDLFIPRFLTKEVQQVYR